MTEFKEQGNTILLVTHDLATVQSWCDAAAWIDEGRVRWQGGPSEVVARYRRTVAEEEMAQHPTPPPEDGNGSIQADASSETKGSAGKELPDQEPIHRWGNGRLEISAVRILDQSGSERAVFDSEDPMILEMDFLTKESIVNVVFGIAVYRSDHVLVYGTNTLVDEIRVPRPLPARGTVRLEVGRLGFTDGNYAIDVAAHTEQGENYDYHRLLYQFAIRSSTRDIGVSRPPHRWTVTAS